ncbi:multidrug effflux MFS transporter [Pseudomonas sp. RIT-To-2]|uniref:multidrug effflux MFS transporter n=1 Tax=Pseudomonas sp. RIT-To-2 TaxID=3462541 RepID=UPI0024134631
MPHSTTPWRYILLLGACTALPPLSIDMALPAISQLGGALHSTSAAAAQSISLFILGFVLGPLLFGPLSDRIGRRPILLVGLALFTLAGLACTLAPNMPVLLVSRLLQGAAAGAAAAMPVAIVRDAFSGQQGRALQSSLVAINNVAPLLAPLLGAAILAFSDWRAIYAALVLAGLALLVAARGILHESHPPQARRQQALIATYRQVLGNRRFTLCALILALNFAGMFAYITASPLVFMEGLGMSSQGFAVLFAVTALGTLGGSWLNNRLVHAGWSETRLIGISLLASLGSSLGLVLLATFGTAPLLGLAALVVVSNLCTGLVMPNATHLSLEQLAHTAGAGAALLRAIQMAGGALASLLVGHFYDGHSAHAMAWVMLGCAALALLCFAGGIRALAGAPPPAHSAGAP